MNESKPYVGMPVTYCIDCNQWGGIIIEISNNKKVLTVQEVDGSIYYASLRKNGQYKPRGKKCSYILLGRAITKLDKNICGFFV